LFTGLGREGNGKWKTGHTSGKAHVPRGWEYRTEFLLPSLPREGEGAETGESLKVKKGVK